MDAGNINLGLIRDLQQQQTQVIQALSRILGAKLGEQLVAKVTEVNTAPAEAKAQLAEQLKTQLAQVNQNSAAPAVKDLTRQLINQLNLVQSAQLNLVQLKVNGQNLLTYTDTQLKPGQLLLIRLDKSQQLSFQGIIGSADLSLEQIEALIAANSKDLTKLVKLLQLTPLPNSASGQRAATDSASDSQRILRQTLAQLLPGKDSRPDLLQALQTSLNQLQKLAPEQRQQLISSQLQTALARVAEQIRSPQQLSLPKGLAQALQNAGPFFEAKLTQKLANNTPGLQPSQASAKPQVSPVNQQANAVTETSGKLPSALLTIPQVKGRARQLANPIGLAVNTGANTAPGKLTPDLRSDLKGALLGLLAQLAKELGTTGAAASTYNQSLGSSAELAKLIAQLGGSNAPELSMKNLRQQLMLLIQQHTLGSLAKIQLQQLHSLNHLADQADSGATPTQSWQLELPVRLGQDLHPLQLHLQSQWLEEADDQGKNERSGKRTRQWQVMLNFDLPDVGRVYAQLILAGENLSANFWADRTSTLEKARARLQILQTQLEQQGLKINQLLCLPGTPAQPKISLGYSLVDIKT